MIDTLNLKLDYTQFDNKHIQQVFNEKMEFKAATRFKNGSSTTVHYNNYKFTLTDKSLTATGSLTKLYHGNNIENLNFNQVQQALMQFETLFEIPFDDAKIKRVDVACSISLDKPINMYFDILTTPDGYKLSFFEGETKSFQSSKNGLHFYDKIAEAKKDDRVAYSDYKNQNILKYEIRFSKNLVQNLNLPDLTMKNLYDSKVYERLIKAWYDGYKKIPKLTLMLASQLNYTSFSSLKNSLAAEGIRSLGGIEVLNMAINNAKTKKQTKYLLKKYLGEFHITKPFSPVLQQELDSKINAIYYNELLSLS